MSAHPVTAATDLDLDGGTDWNGQTRLFNWDFSIHQSAAEKFHVDSERHEAAAWGPPPPSPELCPPSCHPTLERAVIESYSTVLLFMENTRGPRQHRTCSVLLTLSQWWAPSNRKHSPVKDPNPSETFLIVLSNRGGNETSVLQHCFTITCEVASWCEVTLWSTCQEACSSYHRSEVHHPRPRFPSSSTRPSRCRVFPSGLPLILSNADPLVSEQWSCYFHQSRHICVISLLYTHKRDIRQSGGGAWNQWPRLRQREMFRWQNSMMEDTPLLFCLSTRKYLSRWITVEMWCGVSVLFPVQPGARGFGRFGKKPVTFTGTECWILMSDKYSNESDKMR